MKGYGNSFDSFPQPLVAFLPSFQLYQTYISKNLTPSNSTCVCVLQQCFICRFCFITEAKSLESPLSIFWVNISLVICLLQREYHRQLKRTLNLIKKQRVHRYVRLGYDRLTSRAACSHRNSQNSRIKTSARILPCGGFYLYQVFFVFYEIVLPISKASFRFSLP